MAAHLPHAEDDIADRLLDEGDPLSVFRPGKALIELAAEVMGEQVSTDGDEADVRGLRLDGFKARTPKLCGGVGSAQAALLEERGVALLAVGRRGRGEDLIPSAGRRNRKERDLGRISERIEVNVAEKKRRNSLGRADSLCRKAPGRHKEKKQKKDANGARQHG